MSGPLKCRPGDLAVVVQAINAENLGKIVQVIALHDGRPFNLKESGTAWRVRCAHPMLYTYSDGRRLLLHEGPTRDMDLQPIRGAPGKSIRALEQRSRLDPSPRVVTSGEIAQSCEASSNN